ncbi:MAG: hypothetical protein LBN26_01630 [Christensenellaceae bacterium]|jgi:ribosomal protein L34E|nr:hypothetical protein [Christensenellaceae bacterium]
MNTAAVEIVEYVFVMHGIPEGMYPAVAYRRAGGFTARRQKEIKCPYCGRLLTTIDVTAKVELYRTPNRKEIPCHEYRKCHVCHETVGIIFS